MDKSEDNELLFYPGVWSFPVFGYDNIARKSSHSPHLTFAMMVMVRLRRLVG